MRAPRGHIGSRSAHAEGRARAIRIGFVILVTATLLAPAAARASGTCWPIDATGQEAVDPDAVEFYVRGSVVTDVGSVVVEAWSWRDRYGASHTRVDGGAARSIEVDPLLRWASVEASYPHGDGTLDVSLQMTSETGGHPAGACGGVQYKWSGYRFFTLAHGTATVTASGQAPAVDDDVTGWMQSEFG